MLGRDSLLLCPSLYWNFYTSMEIMTCFSQYFLHLFWLLGVAIWSSVQCWLQPGCENSRRTEAISVTCTADNSVQFTSLAFPDWCSVIRLPWTPKASQCWIPCYLFQITCWPSFLWIKTVIIKCGYYCPLGIWEQYTNMLTECTSWGNLSEFQYTI